MQPELQLLILSATGIAVLHTLAGPDHYLPFIVLAKLRQWTVARTLGWTVLCGLGHVLSSVVLGLGGAAAGWSVAQVSWLENVRGGVASWLLLLFGVAYTVWGVWRVRAGVAHKHFDVGENGGLYVYEHKHGAAVANNNRYAVTPWVMFIIFLLGPCEPMIPLLYVPAAQSSWSSMLWLIAIYTCCTLLVMIGIVLLGLYGIAVCNTGWLSKYMHVMGGAALTLCGAGMVFMGW